MQIVANNSTVQPGIFYACTKICFMQTLKLYHNIKLANSYGVSKIEKQIKFMCHFSGEIKYTNNVIYF